MPWRTVIAATTASTATTAPNSPVPDSAAAPAGARAPSARRARPAAAGAAPRGSRRACPARHARRPIAACARQSAAASSDTRHHGRDDQQRAGDEHRRVEAGSRDAGRSCAASPSGTRDGGRDTRWRPLRPRRAGRRRAPGAAIAPTSDRPRHAQRAQGARLADPGADEPDQRLAQQHGGGGEDRGREQRSASASTRVLRSTRRCASRTLRIGKAGSPVIRVMSARRRLMSALAAAQAEERLLEVAAAACACAAMNEAEFRKPGRALAAAEHAPRVLAREDRRSR